MPALTAKYDRIIQQPALTMPGNATGSEAACTALTGSQIRAICGLGTTDNVTFNTVTATTSVLTPLVNNASAALTLGNSTYGVTVPGAATFSGDISMQKATQGYIYAYSPSGTNYGRFYTSDANETHVEAQTYLILRGGSTGIVEVSKSGVTAKVRVYDSGTTKYTDTYHDGTNGILSTSSGNLNLVPTGGTVAVTGAGTYTSTVTATGHRITSGAYGWSWKASGSTSYAAIYDETNAREAIKIAPTGTVTILNNLIVNGGTYGGAEAGVVLQQSGVNKWQLYDASSLFCIYNATTADNAMTIAAATSNATFAGGITASGAIQETYRTSSLDPTVSDIGSGKRQGWYNTTATEFRDWVNVGGTLYKSAAYT